MNRIARICAVTALLFGAASLGFADANLDVTTQILKVDKIIITSVESPSAGWVTIHLNDDGSPGTIIGQVAVNPGTNNFLYVTLDTSIIEPRLIAVLRSDRGTAGLLEVPGPDVPVSLDGEPVSKAFVLHGCRGGIICDVEYPDDFGDDI